MDKLSSADQQKVRNMSDERLRAKLIDAGYVANLLNELAIIRLKTRKAFHALLQAAGRASQ